MFLVILSLSLILSPSKEPLILSLSKEPVEMRPSRGLPLPAPCVAVDGDTIRCGRRTASGRAPEVIRLNGIDAPELLGHCRRGRVCAPGDPVASKAALAAAIRGQRLTIRRWGQDRYGRTIATVLLPDGSSLSCRQWRTGHAIHVPRWDHANMRTTCPH